jgi:hypothetical protein
LGIARKGYKGENEKDLEKDIELEAASISGM